MTKSHKLYILFISILVISCVGKSEIEPFEIQGVTNISTDSILTVEYKIRDSVFELKSKVIDGKFEIQGFVEVPVIASIKFDNDIPGQILLENGTHNKIEINDRNYSLKSNSKKVNLIQEFNSTSKFNQQKKDSLIVVIAKSYPNQSFTHQLIKSWLYFTDPDFTLQEKLCEPLFAEDKQLTHDLESIQSIYNRNKRNKVGTTISNLVFPDTNFTKKNIIDQTQPFTLIDFGASWCIPCIDQNRILKRFYQEIKNEGIEITTISIDKNSETWKNYSLKEDFPWNNVLDSTGSTMQSFLYETIPYALLVNRNGEIIHSNYKITDLEKLLFPNESK